MSTDYTPLITRLHAPQPNFLASVQALTKPASDITDFLLSLIPAFDVDTAVNTELDAVGEWVGQGRTITFDLANTSFSFDILGLGFDEADWFGQFDPHQTSVVLDDVQYRSLLKAKIAANYWNGERAAQQALAVLTFVGLDYICFMVDNFDMSMTVYVVGDPQEFMLELTRRKIFPPVPAGVRIASLYKTSVPDAPIFALDLNSTYFQGLDTGAWAISV